MPESILIDSDFDRDRRCPSRIWVTTGPDILCIVLSWWNGYLWVMRDGNQKPTGCVDTPVLSKNAVLDPENRQSTPKARCTPHITTQEKQRFQLPTFR